MLPFRKILCPIDFSNPTNPTLQTAIELASHFGAELCLLHITPKQHGIPPDPLYASKGPVGYEKELEADDLNRLNGLIEQHIPDGVTARAVVRHGNSAEEIARAVQDEGADLLIISTHGPGGWRHLFSGSITDKLVHHAQCPMLILQSQNQ